MRKFLGLVPAWTALVFLSCNHAAADEFSFKCAFFGGALNTIITFNDQSNRVVAYEIDGNPSRHDDHLGRIFRGKINKISADEIDFDLVQALVLGGDKSGTFLGNTLNRREGSLKFGRAQVPAKCQSIPLRSVMDLWKLLSTYPSH
jgi:hypothetical protein